MLTPAALADQYVQVSAALDFLLERSARVKTCILGDSMPSIVLDTGDYETLHRIGGVWRVSYLESVHGEVTFAQIGTVIADVCIIARTRDPVVLALLPGMGESTVIVSQADLARVVGGAA